MVLKLHKDHFLTNMLQKIVRRKRNLTKCVLPNPANSKELAIPNNCKCYVTITGQIEIVLIGDSGQQVERILIFGRQSWLVFLRESEVWYADGTFKMSPQLFYQVYVIFAKSVEGFSL